MGYILDQVGMLLLCFKNFTLPPTPLKAIGCFLQLQSQLDLLSRPKFAPLSRSFHNAPTEHSFSLNTPVFDSLVSHHDPMCTFHSEMSALFFTSAIMHTYGGSSQSNSVSQQIRFRLLRLIYHPHLCVWWSQLWRVSSIYFTRLFFFQHRGIGYHQKCWSHAWLKPPPKRRGWTGVSIKQILAVEKEMNIKPPETCI